MSGTAESGMWTEEGSVPGLPRTFCTSSLRPAAPGRALLLSSKSGEPVTVCVPKLDSCLTRRKLKGSVFYVRGYLKITSRIINKSVCFKSKRLKFPSPPFHSVAQLPDVLTVPVAMGAPPFTGRCWLYPLGCSWGKIFSPRMKEKSLRSVQQKVVIDLRSCWEENSVFAIFREWHSDWGAGASICAQRLLGVCSPLVRGRRVASRRASGVGCPAWGCGGVSTGQRMALGREPSLVLAIVHHEREAVILGEAGLPDSVSWGLNMILSDQLI